VGVRASPVVPMEPDEYLDAFFDTGTERQAIVCWDSLRGSNATGHADERSIRTLGHALFWGGIRRRRDVAFG
jgi:hypothetical protein